MRNNRIIDHPVLGKLENKKELEFIFDRKNYQGYEGDTIASALLANGVRELRVHEETKTPRGIYCNIGHCYECRVTVDQVPGVRACMTEAKAGMIVESGKSLPSPFDQTDPNDMPRTYAAYSKKSKSMKKDDSNV